VGKSSKSWGEYIFKNTLPSSAEEKTLNKGKRKGLKMRNRLERG
jgi:hypothetical protein